MKLDIWEFFFVFQVTLLPINRRCKSRYFAHHYIKHILRVI